MNFFKRARKATLRASPDWVKSVGRAASPLLTMGLSNTMRKGVGANRIGVGLLSMGASEHIRRIPGIGKAATGESLLNTINRGGADAADKAPDTITPTEAATVDSSRWENPNYQATRDQITGNYNEAAGRQIQELQRTPEDAALAQQQREATNKWMDIAMGRAPSAAQLQLEQGLQKSIAGAKALAAGSSNPALALRQSLQAEQQATSQMNEQMAVLRAQEQAQALGGVSSSIAQQRQGEAAWASSVLQNRLQQQQEIDRLKGYYTQLGMTADEAERRARSEYERARLENQRFYDQLEQERRVAEMQARAARESGILGLLGQGLGAAGSAYSSSGSQPASDTSTPPPEEYNV